MRLRMLEDKDAPFMLEWMHDPKVNKHFATNFSAFSHEHVEAFIAKAQEDTLGLHRACVNENDEYLGTVSLKNIDTANQNAEYAISMRGAAHGTGAAKYATDEILRIAFDELHLEKIYLNVVAKNNRANAFYKKYGFVFEGCFKKHIQIGGKLEDLNWYRMLREEYCK